MIVSIEHDGDLYHPALTSVVCSSTFPFSHPISTITCIAEMHFKIDDVVRIGDIFHGRIIGINSNSKFMTITCRGHSQELNHKYITQDYNQTGISSGDILKHLIDTYLDRIVSGTMLGDTISNYNLLGNQANIFDALKTIEIYDSNHRIVEDVAYTDNKFTSYTVNWMPLPSTSIMTLVDGAQNILDINFQTSGQEIRNKIHIFGGVIEDPTTGVTTQFDGFAEDSISQSKYGTREFLFCDRSFDSDLMCQTVAQGLVNRDCEPKITGTITILGAEILPGDLVTCEFPIHLEGEKISGDYRVVRVRHQLNPWVTTISVGQFIKTSTEIIAESVNKHRLNNLNSIV